jgi:hypothetical protein
MARIVATTFSPSMLPEGGHAEIKEVSENSFQQLLEIAPFTSAVGHKITANILSQKFDVDIQFNRIDVTITSRDILLVAVPQFRAEASREFTEEEVQNAPFRYFVVWLKREAHGR